MTKMCQGLSVIRSLLKIGGEKREKKSRVFLVAHGV